MSREIEQSDNSEEKSLTASTAQITHRGIAVKVDVPSRQPTSRWLEGGLKAMLTKVEQLGDRLLSLVVPHAHASAHHYCKCYYIGDCDVSRARFCCYYHYNVLCRYVCSYRNPCP